jgi:hypothetical protein
MEAVTRRFWRSLEPRRHYYWFWIGTHEDRNKFKF